VLPWRRGLAVKLAPDSPGFESRRQHSILSNLNSISTLCFAFGCRFYWRFCSTGGFDFPFVIGLRGTAGERPSLNQTSPGSNPGVESELKVSFTFFYICNLTTG
jgi:hypothetical protein